MPCSWPGRRRYRSWKRDEVLGRPPDSEESYHGFFQVEQGGINDRIVHDYDSIIGPATTARSTPDGIFMGTY